MNQYLYKKIEPLRKFVRRYLGLSKKNIQDYQELNIKQIAGELAKLNRKFNEKNIPLLKQPKHFNLSSKVCSQADIESEWFKYWCNELHFEPLYLRKLWEYAYILQILFENNYLKENNTVIGFGCGSEPIPAYLANKGLKVLATDLDPNNSASKGWTNSNQLLINKDLLYKPDLISKTLFEENIQTEFVDMNKLPTKENLFDIGYSICALEHLGSIENGLNFIENSLNLIKKNGVVIHTTEYNYTQTEETIDNQSTVLFLRKHFEALKIKLEKKGHKVLALNFDLGNEFFDNYIDLPPFYLTNNINNVNNQEPHLKLLLGDFPATCFGFVVIK